MMMMMPVVFLLFIFLSFSPDDDAKMRQLLFQQPNTHIGNKSQKVQKQLLSSGRLSFSFPWNEEGNRFTLTTDLVLSSFSNVINSARKRKKLIINSSFSLFVCVSPEQDPSLDLPFTQINHQVVRLNPRPM